VKIANRTEVLLLDAGVWIAAVDPDDRFHSCSRPMVTASPLPTTALDLTLYEVANVVGARKQQHDLARRVCRSIVESCGDRLVRADAELIEQAMTVIAEHGLTAYDAAYVAAARRYGLTLVSTDLKDLVSRDLAVAPDDRGIN
jgi:predicted nucleic acid-binding protein